MRKKSGKAVHKPPRGLPCPQQLSKEYIQGFLPGGGQPQLTAYNPTHHNTISHSNGTPYDTSKQMGKNGYHKLNIPLYSGHPSYFSSPFQRPLCYKRTGGMVCIVASISKTPTCSWRDSASIQVRPEPTGDARLRVRW